MNPPVTAVQLFPLLRTKGNHGQVPADGLHRPRLQIRLKHGLDRNFALNSPPPGFGQSCPVAGSHAENGLQILWLLQGRGDSDWLSLSLGKPVTPNEACR